MLNHIMCGAETLKGKVVAILLAISLALMGWSTLSIGVAFAVGQGDTPATPVVQGGGADAPAGSKGTASGDSKPSDKSAGADKASSGEAAGKKAGETGETGKTGSASEADGAGKDGEAGGGSVGGGNSASGQTVASGDGASGDNDGNGASGDGGSGDSSNNGNGSNSDDGASGNSSDNVSNDGNNNGASGDGSNDGENVAAAADDGNAADTDVGSSDAAAGNADDNSDAAAENTTDSSEAASATGSDDGKEAPATETSSDESVDKETKASEHDSNPRISVSQAVRSKPASGAAYGRGESIEYSVAVGNTGDAVLYNIRVSDLIAGTTGAPKMVAGDGYAVKGSVATIAMLAPGKSARIPVLYTVQAADVGAKITNTVTVRAVDARGKVVEASSTSDAVSVTALKAPTAPPPPPSLPALLDPVDGELALPAEFEDVPVAELTAEKKTPQPKVAEDDADEDVDSMGLFSPLGMVGIGAVIVLALAAALLYVRHKRNQDANA